MTDTPQSLLMAGRFADALTGFEAALAAAPDDPRLLFGRANALKMLGRLAEAEPAFDAVLAITPSAAGAHNNRGEVRLMLSRPDAALADFDAAIALQPKLSLAHLGRGVTLQRLHRPHAALPSFEAALALDPKNPDAWFHRALALEDMNLLEDAAADYARVLALQPDSVAALNNRGVCLMSLRRFGEAAAGFARLEQLSPGNPRALNGLATAALHACDWSRRDEFAGKLAAAVRAGRHEVQPGTLLGYSGDPALLQQAARTFSSAFPPSPRLLWHDEPFNGDRIRIAYCSANFCSHAMPRLMAGVFERHDRSRFDITAISFSPDDGSAMQARLKKAFDRFIDMREASDADIARRIADLGIDIVVDLMGLTQDSRPRIFAARPAPVLAQYMGYPGTLGARHYDYIIADAIVAPPDQQRFFDETIIALPDTYWATDDRRAAPGPAPGRAQAGLPETGLVFCCFNNNWKINPPLFDIWARLLDALPGSVLWLIQDSAEAADNLRRAAAARGLDPSRLVFAPRVTPEEHLARHQLADLFLDTLPYNAHTTASDALWVGVPVITAMGTSFAGRVAASILAAMGLPELITGNLAGYESLALALATDPARLAALKARVRANRATTALFDTARFTRNLEAAYEKMRADFLAR